MPEKNNSNRKTGYDYEALAEHYLKSQGLKLLSRNFYARFSEIDLVMLDHNELVFIEVKYRRTTDFGSGAEFVTRSKQLKLIRAASYYLLRHPQYSGLPARFDVVAFTGTGSRLHPEWIQCAFDAY